MIPARIVLLILLVAWVTAEMPVAHAEEGTGCNQSATSSCDGEVLRGSIFIQSKVRTDRVIERSRSAQRRREPLNAAKEGAQRQQAHRELDGLASQVDRLNYIFQAVKPLPEYSGDIEHLLANGKDHALVIRGWKHYDEYPSFEELLKAQPNATYKALTSTVLAKDATGYSFNWFNKTNNRNTSYLWTRGWQRVTLPEWEGHKDWYVYGTPPPDDAERVKSLASKQLFGRDGKLRTPTLIAGHPGSTHDLHIDEPGVVHIQRSGEKKMLLWPASVVDTLYLHPNWHPLARHSIIGTCVADPRTKKIAPTFDVFKAQSVTLRPGDVLFMPPLWGHYTIASGQGVSLGYAHFVQNLTGHWWTNAVTGQQTAEAERHIPDCLAGRGSENLLMSTHLARIREKDWDFGKHRSELLGTCPFVDSAGHALTKDNLCQDDLPMQKLIVSHLHRLSRNHMLNVLQLGARYGTTSCAVSHTMAEQQVPGSVVAVELDEKILPALRKNLASNACEVSVVTDPLYASLPFQRTLSLQELKTEQDVSRFDVLVTDCHQCISRLLVESPKLFKRELHLLFLRLPPEARSANSLLTSLYALGFKIVPRTRMHTEDPQRVSHVVLERLPVR